MVASPSLSKLDRVNRLTYSGNIELASPHILSALLLIRLDVGLSDSKTGLWHDHLCPSAPPPFCTHFLEEFGGYFQGLTVRIAF